jgi:ubiquitin carboxyl-terminal hydrolase 7
LIEDFEDLTVEEIYQKYFFKKYSKGSIWIEQPELELSKLSGVGISSDRPLLVDEDGDLINSPKLLIFIKFFDAETQSLKGITHAFVSEDDYVSSIVPDINKVLGFPEDEALDAYEEINVGTIEKLTLNSTFYQSEISSGDILTFQKSNDTPQSEIEKQGIYPVYPTVESFYLYLKTRIYVVAKKLAEPSEDDSYIVKDQTNGSEDEGKEVGFLISTQAKYEVLAKVIGAKFNEDPDHLRIFVNYGGQRTQLRTNMIVSNIIPKVSYAIQPLFEYEVLSIPLKKLENMSLVKIHWLPQGYMRYQLHDFFVEKTGSIADIVNKLQSKVGFSDEDKSDVLVWANIQSKFYQVLFEATEVQSLEEGIDIYASVLPEEVEILKKYYIKSEDEVEEEVNLEADNPRLVPVLQFHKDPRRLHGISFVFPVYPGEKLKDTKARFHKHLGLGQKDFTKVSICSLDLENGRPVYFETDENSDDDIILANELGEHNYIALDHPDRTTRQGGHQAYGGGISIR